MFLKYINIIFLSSLLLLLPMITPVAEVNILPNNQVIYQMIINSPSIELELLEDTSITINLSLLNLQNNETKPILINETIIGLSSIEINQPGIYIFDLISENINTIYFNQKNIFISHIILILVIGLSNLILWFQERKRNVY